MIRPNEEIHYVALLDESGDTLITIPMNEPLECPKKAEDVNVEVKLNLKLRGRA